MNKDEQLARLLRLKRHEKPDEAYFEGFLGQFHDYQRKAIATQSAAALFWERVCTMVTALRRPSTAWAAAGAYAAIMLLIYAWPAPDHAVKTTLVISNQGPMVQPGPGNPAPPAPGDAPSWQATVPAGQTITVSDGPALQPPASGKRRTIDQPAEREGPKN